MKKIIEITKYLDDRIFLGPIVFEEEISTNDINLRLITREG